jgi:hypothetical protein
MEPDDAATLANGCRNQSHPAAFPDCYRADLSIEREAAIVLDGVRAKSLHRGARLLGVECSGLVTSDLRQSRQAKNVIDPARPS